eukprot:4554474-Prymnesium_polylepis.1
MNVGLEYHVSMVPPGRLQSPVSRPTDRLAPRATWVAYGLNAQSRHQIGDGIPPFVHDVRRRADRRLPASAHAQSGACRQVAAFGDRACVRQARKLHREFANQGHRTCRVNGPHQEWEAKERQREEGATQDGRSNGSVEHHE